MYITQYELSKYMFYRIIQLCPMIQVNHIKYSIETQFHPVVHKHDSNNLCYPLFQHLR